MMCQSSPLFAEFYKYKDKDGVLRFTDNLAEVPENQRKGVDRYKEYVPPPPPIDEQIADDQSISVSSTTESPKTDPSAKKQQTQQDQNQLKIQVLGNKISKIKEDLQKEYKQLLAEKKTIEAIDQKNGKKKKTLIEDLNKKADLLNKKIKAYNQKKATYQQAIKAYQEKIKALSTKK